MKNLIVYYSYEGNCKEISKAIKETIDTDILQLKLKNEKKIKGIFKFVWGGIQLFKIKRPKLEDYNIDLRKYDTIFIGAPVWFGTYAPPINTFLLDNQIQNKKIALFCCSGGNKGKIFENLNRVLVGNQIIGEIEFIYPIKNGIEDAKNRAKCWVKECLNK